MTKKKSKKAEKGQQEANTMKMKQENEQQSHDEAVAKDEEVDQTDEKTELIEKLRNQLEEHRETNLRLHAEFDNYRKRTAKEKVELSKTASEDVIVDLLPVLDDLERALLNLNNSAEDAFIEGVKLIYNKLLRTLSGKGLEEIQAMGQAFDTDYHEAISHMPVEDKKQKDKIIDVVQKGYKLHGKVIRFTKVVVGS